ncbi:MAG: nickel-type superoxide dismutase maturation protease [Caldilineaceae bacterium SB0668_bin_21]|nr:nickel-type superoxide dismutase maturation protease [Caldilineaceae bacterium SB0668_bin_21]MYC21221.1 nickel-type superoxide dismutase maturation protease [Caldilineaceae bacterium SB0662_bin_25]
MEVEVPRSGWMEMALWLIRRRRLFRVTGDSMTPTLMSGAVVMLDPQAYRRQMPQEHEIVVVRHPRQAELQIVKRVAAVIESLTESGSPTILLILASENAVAGSDSRTFGPVGLDLVLGKVVSRLL